MLPWQQRMVATFGHCFTQLTVCLTSFLLHPTAYHTLTSVPFNTGFSSFAIRFKEDGPGGLHFCPVDRERGANDVIGENDVSSEADVLRLMEEVSKRAPGVGVHLDARFWQVDESLYQDVLQCPSSDLRCLHLRSFKLKFAACTEGQLWSSLCLGIEDSSTPTAVLVSKFPTLQHLRLSDYNLSDELLYALADTSNRRCQLRTLTVDFAACENTEEEEEEVYEVCSEAWEELVSSCPGLEVFCRFRRPGNLDSIFKPETPLVGVKIVSECEKEISSSKYLSFCTDHSETLQSLEYDVCDFVDSFDHLYPDELPLVAIATACPRLLRLQYRGIIRRKDVISLAELGRKWKKFVISSEYVMSDDQLTLDDAEAGCDDKLLEELRRVVSENLGYSWDFA